MVGLVAGVGGGGIVGTGIAGPATSIIPAFAVGGGGGGIVGTGIAGPAHATGVVTEP